MRTEAGSFEYLREMLERQATQVAKRFPDKADGLLRALALVHREGVTLPEAVAAVIPSPDPLLLQKGERIRSMLAQAEQQMPDRVEELELLVAAILDRHE
jgi:hypothetical protein